MYTNKAHVACITFFKRPRIKKECRKGDAGKTAPSFLHIEATKYCLLFAPARYQPDNKHHHQDNDENAEAHTGFKNAANGFAGAKGNQAY